MLVALPWYNTALVTVGVLKIGACEGDAEGDTDAEGERDGLRDGLLEGE
jgi:hypothetical protein